MSIQIDWDTFEVVKTDHTLKELTDAIEDVREAMDYLTYSLKSIPEPLEELLIELTDMENEEGTTTWEK